MKIHGLVKMVKTQMKQKDDINSGKRNDISIFLFANKKILKNGKTNFLKYYYLDYVIEEIYNKFKDEDGFLYIEYSETPSLG